MIKMKKITLLLFLILSWNVFSQKQSYIRSIDTIYIFFKTDKFQKKNVLKGSLKSDYLFREYYFFFTHNSETNFTFYHTEYKGFDEKNIAIKSDVKIVNKRFLKNQQNKIIGIDYFKKYGVCDSIYIGSPKPKKIYIIDYDEKRRRKIVLYEVFGTSLFCWKED